MTPQDAKNLLSNYVAERCNEDEMNTVDSWFNKIAGEATYPDGFSMNENIMTDDWNRLIAEKRKRIRRHKNKIVIIQGSVAAAVFFAIALAAGLFYSNPFNKISPASMALAMDTTIRYNSEKDSVILPDGSRVYLNSKSSVRYAKQFNDKQREVFLEGEAYFEVEANANRPFIVNCRGQKLKVLGTEFNIKGYDSGHVITTLVKGAVEVYATIANNPQTKILKPGDQSILDNKGFEVIKVNPVETITWRDTFTYDQIPLRDVLKQLAVWYKVSVDSSRIQDASVDAVYDRKQPLENILKEIRAITGVKLKLNGDTITVE